MWSRLGPGNTVSATGFVSFLEESWAVIPKRFRRQKMGMCRVLSRMDNGYEGEDVLQWNERHAIGYVTKITRKGNFWPLLLTIPRREYRKIDTEAGQMEALSFNYRRGTWSKARRVVAVRGKEDAERSQSNLLDALGYSCSLFVDWDEEAIYRFYDQRSDIENHIREAKYDFSLGHISTDHFHANAADLELRLLAMN